MQLFERIENIFPVTHSNIYEQYKKAKSCFWDVQEIDLSKDKQDWDSLSKDEQFFLENILAFFAQSDQIVNINLEDRFLKDIESLPGSIYCKLFYNFQKMMEDIHSITYETLLHTYITDKQKLTKLSNAVSTVPAIALKAKWAEKWLTSNASFGQRLIAFAILEGVFFSGSFCAIFWIRERGILPGLTKSNEFISRDEGMHYTFAIELFKSLEIPDCSEETVKQILVEAVNIEQNFVTQSFNCALIGMNAKEMSAYVEFVADFMLTQLGMSKQYGTSNPFVFMENISLMNKTNFFEQRVSDYKKSNSGPAANLSLSLDSDF
jgi:ribonucleotide reductase beta subunit family protein with ferritin-like domain